MTNSRTKRGAPRAFMAKQAATIAAMLASSLVFAGCVHEESLAPGVPHLLAEARLEGLTLLNPLAIDREMAATVDKTAATSGTPEQRFRYLVRYLTEAGFVNFQYQEGRSLTAREAFRERRGDCMAYANLFVALARHLGLDAYFVHVSEVKNYYERSGWFFVSSHVAVGVGKGPNALIVDFSWEVSNWQLSLYEAIDDGAALALYYNNVAVDHMVAGRLDEAERLFRFWVSREPGVPEIANNFGVLLNRRGSHAEALTVIDGAIARFPRYKPLFTNGINAARGAHLPARVTELERRGQELEQTDPYFLFARGVRLFQDKRLLLATLAFERARDAKPDSPVILAWLTRAYFAVGKHAEGRDAFLRARALGPGEKVLQELSDQFPELKDLRPN